MTNIPKPKWKSITEKFYVLPKLLINLGKNMLYIPFVVYSDFETLPVYGRIPTQNQQYVDCVNGIFSVDVLHR